MKIVVSADALMKQELLSCGLKENVMVEWVSNASLFLNFPEADAYIDLLYEENIEIWKKLQPKPVFVNSVIKTFADLPTGVIRINAWPTFLSRNVLEASAPNHTDKQKAEEIAACFSKKITWAPDTAGFISARVIACIINEAYLTLDEAVSSKEDIDTAMKLGTNYPYGPFEWSSKIGLKNIYALLETMSKQNSKYQPAASLTKELKN